MLITESKEEKPKVTYRAKSGVFRRPRSIGETEVNSGQDVINNHAICRLSRAARVTFATQNLHRKPLMPQRFSYPGINMPTKIGNRRLRRRRQDKRHHPS